MSQEQGPENPKPVTVAYSGGKMELHVGQEFHMFEEGMWRIEEIKTGSSIYSPSGLGGTPIISCSYVGGEPISKQYKHLVANNRIDFCGDSVALAISIQQTREAAQNPPTS